MSIPQIPPTHNRQVALDIIRGIAVLGILLMNIQSFSAPTAAYLNPNAFGDFQGLNFLTWASTHLVADMKFMSIFSMLFGAGIILFAENAARKNKDATQLHYRRNFWLLIFGLLHAHLIWYGDILYAYAICAFFAFWLRHFTITKLLTSALVFLLIGSSYSLFIGMSIPYMPDDSIQQIKQGWQPGIEQLNQEINSYKSDYTTQMSVRSSQALLLQTQVFITMFIWRIMGMMCLGMACYKLGLFSTKYSAKFYTIIAICGIGFGTTLTLIGIKQNLHHQFSMQYSFFIGSQFNFWGSILVAFGYIGVIALWIKSASLDWLKQRLARVGQMAFSNYIFHSIIFTIIFYGHGLGLFAELQRWQTILLVPVMWLFQLCLSSYWLKRFQFGPLEWCWRCLTYAQVQPLKKLK